jgi:hypothetical protein
MHPGVMLTEAIVYVVWATMFLVWHLILNLNLRWLLRICVSNDLSAAMNWIDPEIANYSPYLILIG